MVAMQNKTRRKAAAIKPLARCRLPAYDLLMKHDSSAIPKRSVLDILFIVFLRLIAVSCLWFGLQYWSMLVGYSLAGQGRFDLLSLPWKVAGAGLAVVFPVAALGLWLTVSWGPVIWLCAAGGQALMYGVWPEVFGSNPLVMILHAAVVILYCIFRVMLYVEKRQRRKSVTVDLP